MPEAKKIPHRAPQGVWKEFLSREDLILITLLSGGFLAVILICLLIPASKFIVDPVARLVGAKAKDQGVTDSATEDGKGIYALGKVQMSLGSASSFVDSDIDLEFNRGALRISSNGKVTNSSSAEQFFYNKENKIRDAIVMKASDFSGPQVQGSGITNFKTHLIQAINDTIDVHNDLITNIYFRKFILFPKESE